MPLRCEPWMHMVSTFSSVGQPSPASGYAMPRALHAATAPERALRALCATPRGLAQSLTGRASCTGQAVWLLQAWAAWSLLAHLARVKIEISFLFCFSLNIGLNFKKTISS
jgi:hypothetical protein